MEDQPTDPGDLTTDADSAETSATPPGRHRMPSGKRLRTAKSATETDDATPETAESAAVEVVTPAVDVPDEASPVSDQPAKKRWIGRRRKKEQEPTPAVEAADSTEAAEAPAEDDVVLVPHRPAGKRLKIAAAAAAVLFVAGGAFLGSTAQPVIANRALVETKLVIARTAASAITTLWSYTPENMDTLAQRSAHYLSGDFAFQYRKFIDSIVATNKQAQVTNTTTVLGTAVESVNQTEASAIVYTNSVATSPVSKNIPSLRYLSYRLEMKRDRSDWRITRMTTITTLDLTPQL